MSLNAAAHLRFFIGIAVYIILVFGTAGTFRFVLGWSYALLVFSFTYGVTRYFLRRDPEFLKSRFHWVESQRVQKIYVGALQLFWICGYFLAGVDFRQGWSQMSSPFWIVGHLLTALGLWIIFQVFRQNRFASRLVETQKDQRVISTGYYGVVRHPMYLGAIPLIMGSALALGSWWSLIPFALVIVVLVLRLLNEEDFLRENLAGYREYCEKTRYRLVPFLW